MKNLGKFFRKKATSLKLVKHLIIQDSLKKKKIFRKSQKKNRRALN